MTEVGLNGSNGDFKIKSWNAKAFSKEGDSGSLIFAIQGGHIYALGILLGGSTALVPGFEGLNADYGISLTSAMKFAGSQPAVSKAYKLLFDQSKTCVLSSNFADALW